MSDPSKPRYRLTLEALKSNTPPVVRLRVALKRLLRSFNLRCTMVEFLDADQAEAGNQDAPTDCPSGPPGGADDDG
jgi:hypothetical protein